MIRVKSILVSITLILLLSCAKNKIIITELKFEKNLIPEGIAIDDYSKKLYLNSLKNNKIVSSLFDGANPKTFLEKNQYGYLSGFGMIIKGDTLYALGNSLRPDKNKSILLLLQPSTGRLINSYTLHDSKFCYWNDLTLSNRDEIFITDSESNKIYKIQRPNQSFEIYLDSEEIPNSNGITISENNKYLYLASSKGICIVDIQSKQLINQPRMEFSGIDGLKFYKNSLYGIVNVHLKDKSQNGLFKFELDKTGTKILHKKKLLEFTNEFSTPTTFDIFEGNVFFIANTQLGNFNGDTNEIIDKNKLQSYKLIQLKLE